MRFSPISSRASRAREGWFAQVDDDEDVGKIVTDEIPTGLYKMGMVSLRGNGPSLNKEAERLTSNKSRMRGVRKFYIYY